MPDYPDLSLSKMSDLLLAAINALNPSPMAYECEADRELFSLVGREITRRWAERLRRAVSQETAQMAQLVEANNKLAAAARLEESWRNEPSYNFKAAATDLRRALGIKTVQRKLTEEHAGNIWKDRDGYYWAWVEKGRKGQRGWCCVGRVPYGNTPDDSYLSVLHPDGESAQGPYEMYEDPAAEPATNPPSLS